MHAPLKKNSLEEEVGGCREAGGQSKMTQMYDPVVQNKACPAQSCRTDVKVSRLQNLETWIIQTHNEL